MKKMPMRVWTLFILACGVAWPQAADNGEAKKVREKKLGELRKALGSGPESGKLEALKVLGELEDDEAIPLLAGKLAIDTDAVRIAAAQAIAHYSKSSSVKALALALPPNQSHPEVLKAFIAALEELDMCSCLPVLLTLAEVNRNALGEEALKAISKIGCSEPLPGLVSLLRRAEIEEKKPDIFEGTDDAPESENKQKNKALAALVPTIRTVLSSLTGCTLIGSREWSLALESGRIPAKRTSVYFCTFHKTSFEVAQGQAKKCPFSDGKTLHEDFFLRHLKE